MSIYPGEPRKDAGKWVLDDQALTDSMALVIEEEMDDLLTALKGKGLPDAGEEDRRILFVAIARGIVKYLSDHQQDFQIQSAVPPGPYPHTHSLALQVELDKYK